MGVKIPIDMLDRVKDRRTQIISALVEGDSLRATAGMCNISALSL